MPHQKLLEKIQQARATLTELREAALPLREQLVERRQCPDDFWNAVVWLDNATEPEAVFGGW